MRQLVMTVAMVQVRQMFVTVPQWLVLARFPEFASPSAREAIPDPNDPATFEMARLQWSELNETRHSQCLEPWAVVLFLSRQDD